ncbi:co-chaperone protein p23-1-like [Gastrolobium bilobum]|uniref:co-chaperone protein p23-1-like n=1 Tax=Gastrolobium bilobum TaxID=150636 RepID=UPI002AAFDDF9|nr:co-chaperone protein p23-1-like [Gastrolobium bilobum]
MHFMDRRYKGVRHFHNKNNNQNFLIAQITELTPLLPPFSRENSKMSRHPPVKWAQRSDELYITVELPDAQDLKVVLEPEGKFYFSATAGAEKIPYEVNIDLFDKVDVNNSKASVGARNIFYLVKKTENKWWDRLLKQGGKPPVFLKVDWDKWVDEDEEQEDNKPATDTDFGDFDFSKMNMGGGEGLDDDMADDGDDDENDTEDQVTGEASADNEPDTKDTVVGNPSVASDTKA